MLPYTRTIIVGCFLGFLICMTAIFCGCASSTLGRALNVGVGAAAVADVSSTEVAKAHGGVEANPLIGSSAWRHVAVKFAGVSAVIALAGVLDTQHPRLAHVARLLPIVIWSGAAVWNLRTARTR